jgi:hypothetical protein
MNKRFELVTADVPSVTGRIYPKAIVEQIMDKINTGHVLATLDSSDLLTVSMDRVVGTVHDAEMDGDTLFATLYLSDTPMGTVVRSLLDAKVLLGLSFGGTGNVSAEGEVSSYDLLYCFVTSTPVKAF